MSTDLKIAGKAQRVNFMKVSKDAAVLLRLSICAFSTIAATACMHVETRTIAIREPSKCDTHFKSNAVKASDYPLVTYTQRVTIETRPVFKEAMRTVIVDLRNDGADLKIENPAGEISTDVRALISAGGDVVKWETTCPFGLKELDDAVERGQKAITHVEPPPPGVLNAQKQVSVNVELVLKK